MRRIALTLGLLVAAGTVLAAGEVEVRFKPLDQLADVGRNSLDGERNVQVLAAHFKALAPRLPDGQRLAVEVDDVDLAGEPRLMRNGSELRVLKGRADWPSLQLRWTLSDGSGVLGRGEQRISDMSYLVHPLRGAEERPLGYETRLIDRWFAEHFGAGAAR
jgi:hypothetical protein